MKNSTLLFTAIAVIFSVGTYAQRGGDVEASAGISTPQIASESTPSDDVVVVAYHVEEKINANFGSQTTTYNVSDLSLVSKNDLGPNNTRVITPIFGKAKPKVSEMTLAAPVVAAMNVEMPKAKIEIAIPAKPIVIEAPVAAPAVAVEKKAGYANIDIIKTYERILEKGYKSADMLKRVANSRFFDGDLAIAAKWYEILFSMTNDLEPVYYYRFAQSLKSISKIDKSNEMMKIWEMKNL